MFICTRTDVANASPGVCTRTAVVYICPQVGSKRLMFNENEFLVCVQPFVFDFYTDLVYSESEFYTSDPHNPF